MAKQTALTIEEVIGKAQTIRDARQSLANQVGMAILSVDMGGSTAYKQEHLIEDWLPRLCHFLLVSTNAILNASGRVAKYMGDELMGIFAGSDAVGNAEAAAFALKANPPRWEGAEVPFKIAADYGLVSLLRFEDQAYPDPQGVACDRCARLAALAPEGTFVCSGAFRERSGQKNLWKLRGTRRLRGVREPTRVYQYVGDEVRVEASDLRYVALGRKELVEKTEALEQRLAECVRMLHDRGRRAE